MQVIFLNDDYMMFCSTGSISCPLEIEVFMISFTKDMRDATLHHSQDTFSYFHLEYQIMTQSLNNRKLYLYIKKL